MQISHEQDATLSVIRLGEPRLDAYVAVSFREKVCEFLADHGGAVAIDVSRTDFIDSSGLGALVAIKKAMAPSQPLFLCGVRPTAMAMFKLTRMDKVFALLPSVDAAREAAAAVPQSP